MGLSRAELFAAIRRDRRLEPGMSQRALGEKYGVHRRTVRQALNSAIPPPRKKAAPRESVLDPAKSWIDAMLREDLTAPRKQSTPPDGSTRGSRRTTALTRRRTRRSATTS